jgi:predicted CXXCH cytochrome family protein
MSHLFIIELLIGLSFLYTGPSRGEAVMGKRVPADCIECHGDLVEGTVLHYPAEDACDNCHESTGASHPSADSLGFRLMDSPPALCFNCHEESTAHAHSHQPVVEGNCLDCHEAHGSNQPALLLKDEKELCLGCHKHISRLVRGSKMQVHTAISDMGCMTCHQAHGSEFRALLVDAYPAEDYLAASTENFGLCFLCHDTDILDAEETEWATGFRNGKQNLHRLHINGNKGRNCRMCHNIHGSPQLYLVEERVSFGSWEMKLNFVPEEQGGSCFPGCHGKLSYQRQ